MSETAERLRADMTRAAEADLPRTMAIQGAPGANSHLAALGHDPDCLPLPCFSFADALDAVVQGRARRAMIPIENSLHGRVADIHFLLPESGLSIVDEYFLPIDHCLLAPDKTMKVERVASHPQALGQCRKYLRAKGYEPVVASDTAAAAAEVAAGKYPDGTAAIASRLAAELYSLETLADGIADAPNNMTRFVVLASTPNDAARLEQCEGPLMTSFLFEVKNAPAALYKAMGGFATNGVNMTKLESYQNGAFSAAEFYADIVGAPGDPSVDRAFEELAFHCRKLRLLGSYKQARPRG